MIQPVQFFVDFVIKTVVDWIPWVHKPDTTCLSDALLGHLQTPETGAVAGHYHIGTDGSECRVHVDGGGPTLLNVLDNPGVSELKNIHGEGIFCVAAQ